MFLQIVPKFQPQTLFTPKRNLAVFLVYPYQKVAVLMIFYIFTHQILK